MSAPPVGPARSAAPHTRVWWLRPLSANPLLRPEDRVEAAVRLLVYLAVMLSIPLACAVGTEVYVDDAAEIATEQATRVEVPARIVSAPELVEPYHLEARVRWQDGRGAHEATAQVPRTAEQGDTVPVWTDPHGAIVPRPRVSEVAGIGGVGTALLVLFAVAAWGAAVIRAARWGLDRRRTTALDAEWRALAR